LIIGVIFLPVAVMAGEGERLLDKFLTDTKTMQASFVQTLRTNDGEVLQESSGQFYLNRPGRFRWNYVSPYPQEIVSDGEFVWIYDVELQQVTVQKQSASLNNTPMALMEGRLNLDEAYTVSELDNRNGIYRLKLSSKSDDTDFSEIVVGVDKLGLRFMQLHDQFEQTTDIVFDNLKSNVSLANTLFEFVPPEGVDVLGGS
jgi:outer membrane lipoprotein carrier protein